MVINEQHFHWNETNLQICNFKQCLLCFYHSWHVNCLLNKFANISTFLIFTPYFSTCVFLFVSFSVPIRQVSVGTPQTWSVGAKRTAKTSSPQRSPRLSWSLCGRPYRTSHSSSWRPLPSSPLASLSTNLLERKVNVRTVAGGWGGWFWRIPEKDGQ